MKDFDGSATAPIVFPPWYGALAAATVMVTVRSARGVPVQCSTGVCICRRRGRILASRHALPTTIDADFLALVHQLDLDTCALRPIFVAEVLSPTSESLDLVVLRIKYAVVHQTAPAGETIRNPHPSHHSIPHTHITRESTHRLSSIHKHRGNHHQSHTTLHRHMYLPPVHTKTRSGAPLAASHGSCRQNCHWQPCRFVLAPGSDASRRPGNSSGLCAAA